MTKTKQAALFTFVSKAGKLSFEIAIFFITVALFKIHLCELVHNFEKRFKMIAVH